MARTTEEILEALKVIRDLCGEYSSGCSKCPLRHPDNETRCGIDNGYPRYWKINEPEVWRAF